MKYKATKNFTHDQLGYIKEGQEVEATNEQAATPLVFGWFELVETVEAPRTKRVKHAD